MSLIITINNENKLTLGEKYTLEQKIRRNLNTDKYGDTYVYAQQTINNIRPDFVIVNSKFGITIIEVKDWSDHYIDSISNRFVSTIDGKKVKNPVIQLKQYRNTIESNILNVAEFINDDGEINIPIKLILFFPYLSEERINELSNYLSSREIDIFGKSKIRTIIAQDFFHGAKRNLTDKESDILRATIFPENKLPSDDSDFDEISCVDSIKALDRQQEEFAKKVPNGHYLVTGLPGSGKTIMLLTRAIHLLKAEPNSKILILTFTKALSDKLNEYLIQKLNQLSLSEEVTDNIQIMTFHKLCTNLIGKVKRPVGMSDETYWQQYIPEKALLVSRNRSNEDKYNHILIDEYQDFRSFWFSLVKNMCIKSNGVENLFLAGDRLQKIYNSEWTSFKDVGINIVGRSKLLKTAYRTNKGHLDLALKLLSKKETLQKEIKNFYELDKLEFNYDNENVVCTILSEDSILKKIHNLIVLKKTNPKDILILRKNKSALKKFIDITSVHPVFKTTVANCTMLSYHNAKGFESKYCIMCDIDQFSDTIISRKILYVGMTRASNKLILCSRKNDGFFKEISGYLNTDKTVTL